MQQLVKLDNDLPPVDVIDIKEKIGYNTDMDTDVAKQQTSAATKPGAGLHQQDQHLNEHAERMAALKEISAKQDQRLNEHAQRMDKQDELIAALKQRSDDHAEQMAALKEISAKQDQRSDDHAEQMAVLKELIAEQGRRIDKSDENLERHIADNQKEHKHTRELFDSKFDAINGTIEKMQGAIDKINENLAELNVKIAAENAERKMRDRIIMIMGGAITVALVVNFLM